MRALSITLIRKTFLLFAFLGMMAFVNAQEMWGVVNGNYAGINSTMINPSSMMHSKLYMDINIATADVFFENNAFYIHKEDYRPLSFLKSDAQLPEYGKDDMPFDYYRNTQRKNIHFSIRALGPSFSIAQRDQAFGFQTAFRTVVSARDIPYEIIPFSYEGLDYRPQHNINYNDDIMLISSMSWMEVGMSYARNVYRKGPNYFTAGITIKKLLGYAGAYLDLENIDYIVNNDSTLNIRNIRGELGYSTGSMPAGQLINGKGFGVDIGVTYERKKKYSQSRRSKRLCKQPYEDYLYRIGISFLDLGRIRFRSPAAQHDYNDVGTFWEHIDTVNFRNVDQFTQMISEVLYGDPNASLTSNRINVVLPSALSLQLDVHFRNQWYVNVTTVLPVKTGKAYIYRPAQLAITPRYETRSIEINMPVSLYDMRRPRIGLSTRFLFMTIGTDNLLGFFNITDFTGFDLYFSLKFNFLKGRCRPSPWHCDYHQIRSL